MASEKHCPCKYIFQQPLSLVPAWQLLSLSSSTSLPIWKLFSFGKPEIAENYNKKTCLSTELSRDIAELKKQTNQQTKNQNHPQDHTFQSKHFLFGTMGYFSHGTSSGWASQPRAWLVNTHAMSNLSSHCHGHRCLTGKLKAANLYWDIQCKK